MPKGKPRIHPGVVLPALDQSLVFFERLTRRHAVVRRQRIIHIHGAQGDAATNAHVVRGSAHLVGVRPSRFEKAGGAYADHRDIAGDAAAVNVLRVQAAFKRHVVALPVRRLGEVFGMNAGELAAQELLAGVVVSVDQPGHGDHAFA